MTQSILQLINQNSIAKLFLIIIAIIGILNAAKCCIKWHCKKKLIKSEKCYYLRKLSNMIECTHEKYKVQYSQNGNRCRGCRGKTVAVSTERVEMYAKSQGIIIKILIVCADVGKALLPYLSILFTLLVAAFVTVQTTP